MRLRAAVTADFEAQHGGFPDHGLAIVAFGKLGSRELTVTSGLDLVLVYDAPADAPSYGPRPLPAATWPIRLTQIAHASGRDRVCRYGSLSVDAVSLQRDNSARLHLDMSADRCMPTA